MQAVTTTFVPLKPYLSQCTEIDYICDVYLIDSEVLWWSGHLVLVDEVIEILHYLRLHLHTFHLLLNLIQEAEREGGREGRREGRREGE